jgi:hypothetical protein
VLRLGLTRSAARHKLRHFHAMRYMDDFCLRGGPGILVAYPTQKLLSTVPARQRRRLSGRIVLAVTANRFYTLGGVRPGTRLAAALRRLHAHPKPFRRGAVDWYVIRERRVSYLLKVKHGIVVAVGIVDRTLTATRRQQSVFVMTFGG